MVGRVVREAALTLAAIVGVVCVVAAIAGLAFGVVPLVFVSNSMAPKIPVGSLALAQSVPAADLRVGDVVSVPASTGERVTHRIVAIESDGEQIALTLQGDGNSKPDRNRPVVREADRVFWSVPGLGRVVTWLSQPPVVFVAGAIVGGWLVWWLMKPKATKRDKVVRSSHVTSNERKPQ